MRTINERFTDEEFLLIEEAKGDMTWRDFIIRSAMRWNKKTGKK